MYVLTEGATVHLHTTVLTNNSFAYTDMPSTLEESRLYRRAGQKQTTSTFLTSWSSYREDR